MVRIDLGVPAYPAFVLKHIKEEFINMVIVASFRAFMGTELSMKRIEISDESISIQVDDESAPRHKKAAENYVKSMASTEFWKGVFVTLAVMDSNPLMVQPLKNPGQLKRSD